MLTPDPLRQGREHLAFSPDPERSAVLRRAYFRRLKLEEEKRELRKEPGGEVIPFPPKEKGKVD
jgi:hypothetical protein